VFGFPELTEGHAARIAAAPRVSNPGCYPTGAIALLRPLVDAGLVPAGHPVTINAVSGYTGGGKQMIAEFEAGTAEAFFLYGLGLEHKHLPELQLYSGLTRRPIFVPSVGNYARGCSSRCRCTSTRCRVAPRLADIEAVLAARYAHSAWVRVMPADGKARLAPEA
jgi:N-acetyl-gamma-glutamyl-phosphate reductase